MLSDFFMTDIWNNGFLEGGGNVRKVETGSSAIV